MGYRSEERTVTRCRAVVTGATCDQCGRTLDPVWPTEEGIWIEPQAQGALHLTLSGGFAEFFDGADAHVVLCSTCAEALQQAFPCIARALRDAVS